MECLVGEEENFELDPLLDRKPVELIAQDWGDMVTLFGEKN